MPNTLRHQDQHGSGARVVETLIYGSRLLLVPIYLGLIVGLGVYMLRFVMEVWHLASHCLKLTEAQTLMSVLSLLDIAMVANLIVMILIGSYSIFVSELKFEKGAIRPQWLNHISAGILKTKMAGSIIGVSSVHLLKYFITIAEKNQVNMTVLWALLALHAAFILGLAVFHWCSKDDAAPHKEHKSEPTPTPAPAH